MDDYILFKTGTSFEAVCITDKIALRQMKELKPKEIKRFSIINDSGCNSIDIYNAVKKLIDEGVVPPNIEIKDSNIGAFKLSLTKKKPLIGSDCYFKWNSNICIGTYASRGYVISDIFPYQYGHLKNHSIFSSLDDMRKRYESELETIDNEILTLESQKNHINSMIKEMSEFYDN